MQKISEILGKNIISLYEGKRIGIIENVAFDKKLKKLKTYIIYDEENDDIDRLFVPSTGVKIEGENAIMIKNLEKVIEDTKNLFSKKNPMNAGVYNLSGTFLGKVTEVLISDDTKDVYSIILNDGTEVLQTQIISGDFKTIIIKAPDEELPVLTSPKKKKPVLIETKTEAENFEPIVNDKTKINVFKKLSADDNESPDTPQLTLNIQDGTPSFVQDKEEKIKNENDSGVLKDVYLNNNESEAADKIPLNLRRCSAYFGFLIGRRVEHDVYNARNEKIVNRHTIITTNTLDICKKWGKLIVLARNSAR